MTPSYQSDRFQRKLRHRYFWENGFKTIGLLFILGIIGILIWLLGSVLITGYTGFFSHQIRLSITYDPQEIDPSGNREIQSLRQANYNALLRRSVGSLFPDVRSRQERLSLYRLISQSADFSLQDAIIANPSLIGTTQDVWIPVSDSVDQFLKGNTPCGTSFAERQNRVPCSVPENQRKLTDQQVSWIDSLILNQRIERHFNTVFFTSGDSRTPEYAGIFSSIIGSLLSLSVCFFFTMVIAVASAIYLEEFAQPGRFTKLIEVSISNLMAIPSIVFGLLGLTLFLDFLDFPRSAPIVAGIVLGLMTLPVVVIATRASLRSVPLSLREAALGLGTSPFQTVFRHVLPYSMPGILTGSIIGMSQALGETAPLLMIGMVAFIVETPVNVFDPATVLPVQIFLWFDSPERGFIERTAAAILILLGLLVMMHILTIFLRKKFERKW